MGASLVYRLINVEIDTLAGIFGDTQAAVVEYLCECPEQCLEHVAVTRTEFAELLGQPGAQLLAPGHEGPPATAPRPLDGLAA